MTPQSSERPLVGALARAGSEEASLSTPHETTQLLKRYMAQPLHLTVTYAPAR